MTKKILISIIILVACVVTLNAQLSSYNQPHDWNVYFASRTPMEVKVPANVSEIRFVQTDKKAKKTEYLRKYDQLGRISENYFPIHNGVKKIQYKYTYSDTSTNPTIITEFNSKAGVKQKLSYLRTDDSRLYNYVKTDSKSKIVEKSTWQYEGYKILRTDRYKKGGIEIEKSWIYQYDENNKQFRTLLLDSKGETIYEWSYECNEEGTKLDKRKDETQICYYTKTDDNYLTHVYQTFDDKGKIMKNISKYTLADTLLVETITKNEEDEITYKCTYDLHYTRPLVRESYKDGVVVWKQINTYKDGLLLTIESYQKKNLSFKLENIYNSNNLIIGQKKFDSKNRLTKQISVEYVYCK